VVLLVVTLVVVVLLLSPGDCFPGGLMRRFWAGLALLSLGLTGGLPWGEVFPGVAEVVLSTCSIRCCNCRRLVVVLRISLVFVSTAPAGL